jgi:hypothetical protein
MPSADRARDLAALHAELDRVPLSGVHWKGAHLYLERLAPEPSVVPRLTAALDTWPERWMAASLLGATRHRDAWEPLTRLALDPTSGDDGNWATSGLAKVGGDDGHAQLLAWLLAPQHPIVLDRILDAIRAYGRPEGALALRDAWVRGAITHTAAAVRIAKMPVRSETLAAWWDDGDNDLRALTLTVLVTMAAPGVRRAIPLALRDVVRAALDAPPRPLDRFDRVRLEEWLAGIAG